MEWKPKLIHVIKHGLHTGNMKRTVAQEIINLMKENKPFRILYNQNRGYTGIQYF